MMQLRYYDEAVDRFRTSDGRFAKLTADETCPNGCERYGGWWFAEDCPRHLGFTS